VQASDERRRRVVRDLHDGAQQHFVHAIMNLQLANARRGTDARLDELVDESLASARTGLDELRELARGIHPPILTHHGLAAAVESLADRAPVPVEIAIPDDRYSPSVESAAYFVAAEALTNVAKYANATMARVDAAQADGRLRVTISDDGVGGARRAPESGLSGLEDRVTALGGSLLIDSPEGEGTRVTAEIPLA
jgi:signal transduction histidine kinase